jgi:hypothetical protein
MRRLRFVLALAAGGCQLGADEQAAIDCVTSSNCGGGNVCFLGRCVEPGFNITDVHLDMTPPSSSGLLPQVDVDSPRDLSTGSRQDVSLRGSVQMRGRVYTDSNDRAGVLIARRQLDPALPKLPSTTLPIQSSVSGDFTIGLVPGQYTLAFEPSSPQAALPPYSAWFTAARPLSTDDADVVLDLQYPRDSDMVVVTGSVIASVMSPNPVADAVITGKARDADDNELHSTSAVTNQDGVYTLVFPPGALPNFEIKARPGLNPLVPNATADLNFQSGNELERFSLELGGITEVQAALTTIDGLRVPNATVLFEGTVAAGTFTTTALTDFNGVTADLDLLPGTYTVTAAPSRSGPYALRMKSVCIGDVSGCTAEAVASRVDLIVGSKVRLVGYVTAHNGAPVGGARVLATLQSSPVTREFSTTTRGDGGYILDVDPGTEAAPARYEIVIEPEQSGAAPLPRHRELIEVSTASQQDVGFRLYDASLVHGRVYDPAGRPLSGVRVAIYSTSWPLGEADNPLLIGLGQSSEDGEFVVPIPKL